MSDQIKSPTRGPWIVSTNSLLRSSDGRTMIVVSQSNDPKTVVAICGVVGDVDEPERIANAALIAIAPDMLEALTTIQEELMTSKDVIDLETMQTMISGIFEKLANEAGEEL